MRRALSGMAAAIVLAVALAGCSYLDDAGGVVDDVQKSLVADQKLSKLTDELRERGDVDKVKETVLAVTLTAKFAVLMHEDATPSAIAEVTLRIDDVMRSAELQPFKRELNVKARNASIRQTDFEQTPIDYASEVAYWGTVESTVGGKLVLVLETDSKGSFTRTFASAKDETVVAISHNFDALAALTPPNATDTQWVLPGFTGAVTLSDGRVLGFMANMAAVTNLLRDEASANVLPGVKWVESPPGVVVFMPAPASNRGPTFVLYTTDGVVIPQKAAVWPLALATVREALATGIPNVQLQISMDWGEGDEGAHVHIGDCSELVPATTADHQLVAELVASGIDLSDTAAGVCSTFANP